ncbi:uncharacterized protein LOC127565842 [Drosophila albomicans]|uniref:Uncharacterized protein LOC127565842 n=1 Tax=Drosophila albomicans TaxID=7291 RepID=A0A9C6T6U1_DROAB|nr:uncharacterized protein LOC127565842 [Drosophila albomicans]
MTATFVLVLGCLVCGALAGRPAIQGPVVSAPTTNPAPVTGPAINYLPPSKPTVVVNRPVVQSPGPVVTPQILPRPTPAATTAKPITLPIAPSARPISIGKIGIPAQSGSRTVGSRAPY